MTARFDKFLPFIFKWEVVRDKKGNVITEHDPQDPGGATRWGIDQRSHPRINVDTLTEADARGIYWDEWQARGIETMSNGLGEVYFNCCVNCGVGRARKILAKCHTASSFLTEQENFYQRLVDAKPSLRKFLKGWLNRTKDLRKFIGA